MNVTKALDVEALGTMVRLILLASLAWLDFLIFHIALTMYCLELLAERLKPRGSRASLKERVMSIICFAPVTFVYT